MSTSPAYRETLNAGQFNELLASVGWSQKELAHRCGRNVSTVSRWSREGAPQYAMTILHDANRLIGKDPSLSE